MNLLQSFVHYIKTESLFQPKDRLLLAVSGGVDSVVLCELCKQAGLDFAIAHCNFKLRGEESDGDETFVKALAEKYGVEFFVKKFDTEKYAQEKNLSIQVAARELRYNWFNELLNTIKETSIREAQKSSLRLVGGLLTAHHADDNMETMLMNFFKGSGINGLKGILPKQKKITRPLLFAAKEQLVQFAKENNLAYREDSSNSSDKYTRNYFRNQLIPGLEKVFPQVKENLLHNASRFREINCIYNNAISQIKKKLITKQGNEIHLPVLKLLHTDALTTVLYEIIKDFGFTAHQTEEVQKLLNSDSGKYVTSASHRILRNRKWLVVSALQETAAGIYLLEDGETEIIYPQGKLSIAKNITPAAISKENLVAQLDARGIEFPLLLRKWKTGDYFYPLGMLKKKKLSRFFIDQKMSLNQKENTWVIESNKKIIWIVGIRIDDRFKITSSTTHLLHFSLGPSK